MKSTSLQHFMVLLSVYMMLSSAIVRAAPMVGGQVNVVPSSGPTSSPPPTPPSAPLPPQCSQSSTGSTNTSSCLDGCNDSKAACMRGAESLRTTYNNCVNEANHAYNMCVANRQSNCQAKMTLALTQCNSIWLAYGTKIGACQAAAATCAAGCIGLNEIKECLNILKK